jgi:RNA polymerase sigma factor (sigma-70 family)
MKRGAKGHWQLTPAAFERLLLALDTDQERAALAYEQLRQRIVGLMRWWGAWMAEDLADQTLDRVARKLEEGSVVPAASFGAYVRGVARMIFYEWTRSSRAQLPESETVAPAEHAPEPALDQLDRCVAALEPAEQKLVLRYYGDGKHAELRRALAEELGISQTALRIRAHRLRQRLERCMSECLAKN